MAKSEFNVCFVYVIEKSSLDFVLEKQTLYIKGKLIEGARKIFGGYDIQKTEESLPSLLHDLRETETVVILKISITTDEKGKKERSYFLYEHKYQ